MEKKKEAELQIGGTIQTFTDYNSVAACFKLGHEKTVSGNFGKTEKSKV